MTDAPTFMEPAAAAAVLVRTLTQPKPAVTVADASVASGLALRDAEAGLTWLTSEYRGQYRITEAGDVVHVFPTGFTKPWETRQALRDAMDRIGAALAGALRFIVRAWLLIAIVAYALIFVAIALGLAGRRDDNRRSDDSGLAGVLLRLVAEAFYWTFHPFSPLAYGVGRWDDGAPAWRRAEREGPKVPLYERVNRFVLGPPVAARDPHEDRARILAEIRALEGRIALADVMRVTGLPRELADPLMARLMLDHDGTVEVGENGGIFYRFASLRRTAGDTSARERRPAAAWDRVDPPTPLTGNTAGENLAIGALNGFNLLASLWAFSVDLTLENLTRMLDKHHVYVPVHDGAPIVLGWIPLVFSIALFVIPAVRAVLHTRERSRHAAEAARLGVLREVVTHASKSEGVPEASLRTAVRIATGSEPTERDLARRVAEFGGEPVVTDEGAIRYRFPELESDAEAASEDRAKAPASEAALGAIAYDTDR